MIQPLFSGPAPVQVGIRLKNPICNSRENRSPIRDADEVYPTSRDFGVLQSLSPTNEKRIQVEIFEKSRHLGGAWKGKRGIAVADRNQAWLGIGQTHRRSHSSRIMSAQIFLVLVSSPRPAPSIVANTGSLLTNSRIHDCCDEIRSRRLKYGYARFQLYYFSQLRR